MPSVSKSSSRVLAALDLFDGTAGIRYRHVSTPWDYAGTMAALREALAGQDQPFDGVFGLSDTLALAAYEVCTEFGLLRSGGRHRRHQRRSAGHHVDLAGRHVGHRGDVGHGYCRKGGRTGSPGRSG